MGATKVWGRMIVVDGSKGKTLSNGNMNVQFIVYKNGGFETFNAKEQVAQNWHGLFPVVRKCPKFLIPFCFCLLMGDLTYYLKRNIIVDLAYQLLNFLLF